MPNGRVALVTGGGSGIGRATAIAFARNGDAVVVADQNEAGADTAEEIIRSGGTGTFVQCDVSDEMSVCDLIGQTVSRYGRLDVAFNNAGIEGVQSQTADCTAENFDRVMAVNLRGVWLCMREEIRQMLKQDEGGSIVNTSSVAGLIGFPNIPAYAASKHAVIGLTRTAALEYAKSKIRINALCPGAIETPMLQRFVGNGSEAREAILAAEPIGRVGSPEEVAGAVLWLCNSASFVTGTALPVDGGWTAG
jgi:NAD(P)-dependent dehydrogenase (short-subunit alcohol dehydrogenase family)